MKKVIIAFLLIPMAATAQTVPLNPEADMYRQLLNEANGRVASEAKLIDDLQQELAKLKDANKPAPSGSDTKEK